MTRRRESRGARALAGVGLVQREVAERADLDQTTVSKVLRGVGSEDARERVLAAVEDLAGVGAWTTVHSAVVRAEREAEADQEVAR